MAERERRNKTNKQTNKKQQQQHREILFMFNEDFLTFYIYLSFNPLQTVPVTPGSAVAQVCIATGKVKH